MLVGPMRGRDHKAACLVAPVAGVRCELRRDTQSRAGISGIQPTDRRFSNTQHVTSPADDVTIPEIAPDLPKQSALQRLKRFAFVP